MLLALTKVEKGSSQLTVAQDCIVSSMMTSDIGLKRGFRFWGLKLLGGALMGLKCSDLNSRGCR